MLIAQVYTMYMIIIDAGVSSFVSRKNHIEIEQKKIDRLCWNSYYYNYLNIEVFCIGKRTASVCESLYKKRNRKIDLYF